MAGNCGQNGGGVEPALGNRTFPEANPCNVAVVAIVAMPLVLVHGTLGWKCLLKDSGRWTNKFHIDHSSP